MKTSIENLLAEIRRERERRRRPLPMQSPASDEQLQKLAERMAELAYQLPAAYVEVLHVVNGIDSNGIVLYASETQTLAAKAEHSDYTIEGVVEANLLWRDYPPNEQYIFFAESGDRLYCHNLVSGRFESVDRLTKELTYAPSSFATCEELLELILNHMLDRYEEA